MDCTWGGVHSVQPYLQRCCGTAEYLFRWSCYRRYLPASDSRETCQRGEIESRISTPLLSVADDGWLQNATWARRRFATTTTTTTTERIRILERFDRYLIKIAWCSMAGKYVAAFLAHDVVDVRK